MDDLKDDLNELKPKFWKLESDVHISSNANDKLRYKLVVLEGKCHANEQYSRREYLEILRIPAEVADKDIEEKELEILDKIDSPVLGIWLRFLIVYPQNVSWESCIKTKSL